MSHPALPYRPIEEIQFTRHQQATGTRRRRIADELVCDAIVNGRRRPAGQGTAWFFGRNVAVLAAESAQGQVTRVLTACYA